MSKLNYKEVTLDFLDAPVIFTYGKKSYSKYLKGIYKIDKSFNHSGVATELQSDTHYSNVIGLKKSKCIYTLKSIMVHEISHVVTHIINRFNIQDDEFRSYLNQYLYKEGIFFIEDHI